MEVTSVTSKGRVTIPKSLRQKFWIRKGSKIEFSVAGDHLELRVVNNPVNVAKSGFGLLKARKSAVSADFDPAMLFGKLKTTK